MKMDGAQELEEVIDQFEMMTIQQENQIIKQITPELIERLVLPTVREIIDRDNRWSGYYIWPMYREGYKELEIQREEGGRRRNPQRFGEYKFKVGDLPITIGSVEIGRLIRSLPLFCPEAWNGAGI
jgi:hypothetical protein